MQWLEKARILFVNPVSTTSININTSVYVRHGAEPFVVVSATFWPFGALIKRRLNRANAKLARLVGEKL